MKKLFNLFIICMLAIMIIPISKVKAEESSSIPLEDHHMLSTYVPAVTDEVGFNALNDDDVVFHVGYYEIRKDYLIEQENGLYLIDVSKVKNDDYVGPPRNSRVAITYVTLSPPYYSAHVEYTSYYTTGANSGYTDIVYRCYATRNQINTYFIQKPSNYSAQECVYSICSAVIAGTSMDKDYASMILSIYDAFSAYASLTMRNAFRTYVAGGNGGYFDAIDAKYTQSIGYGVWDQKTIEKRDQSSGPRITTNIKESRSS